MKRKFYPLVLIFILISSVFLMAAPIFTSPVMAASTTTTEIYFINKNPISITIYLKGPQFYTVIANPGVTVQLVKSGEYTLNASFCGMQVSEKISFTRPRMAIRIKSCKLARVAVSNLSNTPASGTFVGPSTISFSISAHGKTQPVYLIPGNYTVRVNACGKTYSGKVFYADKYNAIRINCGKPMPSRACSPVKWDDATFIC